MQKQDPVTMACSAGSPNPESKKKPSMACHQEEALPTRRSAAGHEIALTDASPPAPEDFEFCVLSSGGLALAGNDDMCAADEVFSGGKLLPLRPSSATSGDASELLLLRSDSGATSSTSSFSSRSSSHGASSSSCSSVSRSSSSKSDPASLGSLPNKSASSKDTKPPPRRSLSSSSLLYAHPSPSPRPPRRSAVSASSTARRSTGSAVPAAWGVIRLGVVGAPDVYTRRVPSDSRMRGGSQQSTSFEQANEAGAREVDRKLGLGLLGAGLVCSCTPDAVAPVGTVEAAAAEARRRKKAEDKKRAAKQSTSRRSRILRWLEELSSKTPSPGPRMSCREQ